MKTEDDLIIEFCQQNGINPESGLGWMRKMIVESSLAFDEFIKSQDCTRQVLQNEKA